MSQRDRDRLVVLRNLKARRIRQTEAAEQLGITTRQVRRLLQRYKQGGERAMVHGLRGRVCNRKLNAEKRAEARPRRSSRGELVQRDTSDHDWLEGRGGRLYLIHMIDDAGSELLARFVGSDSTEENMPGAYPDRLCAARVGHRLDCGVFATGQRTSGAQLSDGAGSSGEGIASGGVRTREDANR